MLGGRDRAALVAGSVALVLFVLLPQPSPPLGRVERVLVTGGNGYFAQHLIAKLGAADSRHAVAYTVRSVAKELHGAPATPFTVADLSTDLDGLEAAVRAFNPTVVVHAAAMSSPKQCEADPVAATRVNAPEIILDVLARLAPNAVVVYLSTEQVYRGDVGHVPYPDDAAADPRNAYGHSKLAFEQVLRARWPRHVVLRSSNMVGPRAPYTLDGKFAQWIAGKLLAENGSVSLFDDEFRSFVSVGDVVDAVDAVVGGHATLPLPSAGATLNCGGAERLSRVALGRMVARACDVDISRVAPTPAAATNMGYDSPPDLTLDSAGLAAVLGVKRQPSIMPTLRLACAEMKRAL
jgi:dTDP-4-dehydrorhamnose reductase